MNEFSIRNTGIPFYKILFVMLLALLAGSIIYFIAVMWLGPGLVIDWQTIARTEELQLPLLQEDFGLLRLNLQADSYVVQQTFRGSELRVNLWPAYVLLTVLCLGLSMSLAVITSLGRFWYIVGMGLFCALIVGLRLEQIQLFGRIDKTADILFFLLFLPLSYFFQAIKTEVSLLVRFLSFLAVFVLLGVLIWFFSAVSIPFLYIANYGLPALMVLSFLLLLLVAPEIIAGLLYLVTASNTENSRNSMMHFSIASLVYLGNLILYYLQLRGIYDLDFYLISPFWLLPVSIMVAFYTLNARSLNFSGIISYRPLGVLLYLSLAVICLATVAYVFATANDPLVETFEDAILYTHLGLGFFFFLYIIVNFFGLLKENKRVYRVLYKPVVMPLFSARFAGVLLVFGLYSLHGIWSIYQPVGGYYNGIGDLYMADNNYFLAEQYYRQGSQYKYGNHRSNYALASLSIKAEKPVAAMMYLKKAIERQPTPYAYANLAKLYFENNLYFDGLFTLQEGIERYPREGRLFNNLGVQFGKTQVPDSALYYLRVAAADEDLETAAVANELALLAKHNFFPEEQEYPYREDDIFYQTNLLALMNRSPAPVKAPEKVNPAVLREPGGLESAWLLNYALLKNEPDSLLPLRLQALIDSSAVHFYEEPAVLALGLLYYQQQNHFDAFRRLEDLALRSTFNQSRYYKLLGAWSLEQDAPLLAARFFGAAATVFNEPEAWLFQALALTEAGKPRQAEEILENVADSLWEEGPKNIKKEMLRLLRVQSPEALSESPEEEAVQVLRMQWGKLGEARELAFLNDIKDPQLKSQALAWLISRRLKYGSYARAKKYLQQWQQVPAGRMDEPLLLQRQHLAAKLAILQSSATEKAVSPVYPGTLGKLMAAATEAASSGDTVRVINLSRQLMQATPFVEEMYVLAIPYLNAKGFEEEGYGFILKAMNFNPGSVILKELYILQSLRMNLEDYAEEELLSLGQLSEKERFNNFLTEAEKVREQYGSQSQNW